MIPDFTFNRCRALSVALSRRKKDLRECIRYADYCMVVDGARNFATERSSLKLFTCIFSFVVCFSRPPRSCWSPSRDNGLDSGGGLMRGKQQRHLNMGWYWAGAPSSCWVLKTYFAVRLATAGWLSRGSSATLRGAKPALLVRWPQPF